MFHLNELGILCSLGMDKAAISDTLLGRNSLIPEPRQLLQQQGSCYVAKVADPLNIIPESLQRYDCRNNRLAAMAVDQIRPALNTCINRYGAARVGVVMGTSTSGIAATEHAIVMRNNGDDYPEGYHAAQGMLSGLGEFVAALLAVRGPAYTLSTACSSSANAALSARRLISAGICDAVVFGGVDSLCDMTLQGFGALDAQSKSYSRPFCIDRDGINIGEAAAVFLMSKEPTGPYLAGGAGSSDAHHISAPHPDGDGAFAAMRGALHDAQLEPEDIGYLNLHGTGTPHNDAMESKAVSRLFGETLPCSSSKSMTGHTLGAAGALELGLCWLLLTRVQQGHDNWRLPPSLYLSEKDPNLAYLNLIDPNRHDYAKPRFCQSNSFAFGGSNVSLIIGSNGD